MQELSSKRKDEPTRERERERERTFSPPDKLAIFFQLFFGGLTLKTTPSENGSRESTSSSSASPPSVIICNRLKCMIHDNDQNTKEYNNTTEI